MNEPEAVLEFTFRAELLTMCLCEEGLMYRESGADWIKIFCRKCGSVWVRIERVAPVVEAKEAD